MLLILITGGLAFWSISNRVQEQQRIARASVLNPYRQHRLRSSDYYTQLYKRRKSRPYLGSR